MECNKEEAIRAKELAEIKMQSKDFSGAKKIALKAQRLFTDLENISQMITVCDVHCCADFKINGEMDWYGILQVEQTADDTSIKKQYRRLALQLHPDKNKFPGAEAAFKLIGEANMTLSDKVKRSYYDMKRSVQPKPAVRRQPAQSRQPNTAAKSTGQNANKTYTSGNVPESPSNPQNASSTFWTVCPNCCAKFQYHRTVLNRTIPCHRCLKHYVASEISMRDVPMPNHNFAPRPNHSFPTQPHPNFVPQPNHNFAPRPTQNFAPRPTQNFAPNSAHNFFSVHIGNNLKQQVPVQPTAKNGDAAPTNVKRGKASSATAQNTSKKRVAESSESECATDTEEECEEIDAENGVNAENGVKRPPKRSRCANQTDVRDYFKGKQPKGQASDENEEVSNVKTFSLPDSEFYNFEKERDPKKFAADQIWAVYDDRDAMPRFYVRIREVHDPFTLRFTWLENNPISEFEQIWTSEDLPVACGNYRLGKSDVTKDVQMFSHKISWNKGTKRNTFNIYPIKGEVWAIFKGWDVKWTSNANRHKDNEFEVVEVISDSPDGSEFLVVHLIKVQGFVSLFMRSTDGRKSLIPRSEILRFSHRVPSYRVSKDEREGVPEGSFELDTASLPENFDSPHAETSSVKPEKSTVAEDKCAGPVKKENPGNKNGSNNDNNTSASFCDLLPNEFHDFTNDRSIDKFKKGQVWALYSDVDQYPKFYAKIKSIDYEDVVITAWWVELCPKSGDEARWTKKGLPAACGRFEVECEGVTFESTELFSHIVKAAAVGKKELDIYPQKGEIWALYKDWNVNWSREDFGKCNYIIVEVLGVGTSVKVQMLTRVEEYNFVFKADMEGGSEHVMVIPLQENLRFSHQIPAIKLTDQMGGALHGYWELDSASVPNI